MKTLFAFFVALFGKLPFCSLPGAVAGALVGLACAGYELDNPGLVLVVHQLIVTGLLLGFVGLLLVLFLFGVLLRYGVVRIFWPALVNALLTGVLTVFACHALGIPGAFGWLGLLIGIVVGAVLCRLACCEWRLHAKA